MMNRRTAISLLGATAFAGCAPAISVARLGDDPFEGGIGGTGIVGLMTGTGSVLINGLRVEVPDTARILINGQQTSDSDLVPGKALTIMARTRLGRLEAQRIDIDDPLVGTLHRAGDRLSISGTALQIEPGAKGAHLPGQQVAASGLWQPDGSLRVSSIQAAPSDTPRLAGVLAGGQDTGWRIGQTLLRLQGGQRLQAGQFAVATGTFDSGIFVANSIQMGRFRQGAETMRNLSVEGFLEPVATAPGYRISGLGHSFGRRLALDPYATVRAVYFGGYDGRFQARRAVTLPNTQSGRHALLRPADGANYARALSGDAASTIEQE